MTLRRMFVLLKALPHDSQFKTELREHADAAQAAQNRATPEQIRARAARYRRPGAQHEEAKS